MNLLERNAFIAKLNEEDRKIATEQLRGAGFDINALKSTPLFGDNKRIVDGILTAIQPNDTGFSGRVSMVDYGSLDGGRKAKKT